MTAPGMIPMLAGWMQVAAAVIDGRHPEIHELAERTMNSIWMSHDSPHIRELATEALHYLNEDANG